MIGANAGYDDSIKTVRNDYKAGYVTKDAIEKTIRAYGSSIDEMKSDQRDRAGVALEVVR